MNAARPAQAPLLGVGEWFRPGEYERAERAIDDLRRLRVTHLRMGVSWADWASPRGEAWYAWLLPTMTAAVEVLPCFHYTPPSLGLEPRTNAPPRATEAYGEFVAGVLDRVGDRIADVELWNEPNNLSDWDWRLDPRWDLFAAMVRGAAAQARRRGRRVVLGGMCPIDPPWLECMWQHGVLDQVDVVGVHGFPGTWQAEASEPAASREPASAEPGDWQPALDKARQVLDRHGLAQPFWITETAYSTWRHDERGQITAILRALAAPVERVYWGAIHDLDPAVSHRDGFHLDERPYHLGLTDAAGRPKLAYRLWEAGGVEALAEASTWTARRRPRGDDKGVLITGGAGFIGTNLAHELLEEGARVTIFDSLARPGVEQNLRWLRERHRSALQVTVADVRDRFALARAVRSAGQIYHFAAQVAVTTSVTQPVGDFEINALGTLNLLEALRTSDDPASLVFTSTNKVYGSLDDVALRLAGDRYEPVDDGLRASGIGEWRPLDFHSPYGCSKGAADQYVLDYARTYGLQAVVFRMSCIYGRHQCGNEDQGWVAHLVARALSGQGVTIYGDGKQVRDVLFADDLVRALRLAQERAADLCGEAFNIGGGPSRTLSLLELLQIVEQLGSKPPAVCVGPWRPGDQRYYVSDTSKFTAATGWRPAVGAGDGVRHLAEWLVRSGRVAADGVAARLLAS
jgi:CDP-paratose 2-epimerase